MIEIMGLLGFIDYWDYGITGGYILSISWDYWGL
jgi:hypothetical protein